MGRAARWFRGLLGGKKSVDSGTAVKNQPAKMKKGWDFMKSIKVREKGWQQECPPPETLRSATTASEKRKGSYTEASVGRVAMDGDEQNKRAIAVAAATAAAAEAAVAAAQAAAAVVRLTSSGRSVRFVPAGAVKQEEWAAVKIQSAFRGYLARRALRALKGLVKLQALIRGNIVRKQAAETLRCMKSLVRVQARARACRSLRSETIRSGEISRSIPGPPTPDKYEPAIRTNSSNHNRSSSSPKRIDSAIKEKDHSTDWNWLDQWMESSMAMDDEKNAKILEIDTVKQPHFNSRKRISHRQSSSSTMNSDQHFLRRDSASTMDGFPFHDAWDFGESSQFFSATSRPGSSRRGQFTPARSDCSRSLFSGYSDYPNYMSNTESSRAKARSQSAPKQRQQYGKSTSIKGLSPAMVVATAASGRRSSLQTNFANKWYPGSGRLDRLGMPLRM